MRGLLVCVHCWTDNGLRPYHKLLHGLLQTFIQTVKAAGGPQDRMIVFGEHSDLYTRRVVEINQAILPGKISLVWQPKEELLRRSVGRQLVSKLVPHDIDFVYFADADYRISPDFIHGLEILRESGGLPEVCYPRRYKIHTTHELGEFELRQTIDITKPYSINEADYSEIDSDKAIGGLMIYTADALRSIGYVPAGSKWEQPTDAQWYSSFRDDRAARQWQEEHGRQWEVIDIGGLYRARHLPMAGNAEELGLVREDGE